ncbi:MAG: PorV/PorQ family protein [Candidatus Cloacimonetes bacterium]|nr:PorV/PorQ family protein [Candidatus Cloacimonadota bacterium]
MLNRKIIVTVVLAMMLILPYGLVAISQGALLFLTFEPGGRASGMGRAYSAIADDAYAPWWNPGATAFNRKTQLAGTHIPWLQGGGAGFDDIFYEYLGWNQYFEGIGNINVHLTLLDAGSQPQMDESGNYLGDFHSFDFAASAGYSYELIPNNLGLGGNFKMMYSYLGPGTGNTEDDGSAIAFAFDVGAKYKDLFLPNLDASLVIQNVGPNVTFIDQSQSDPLPMTFRAGLAYKAMDTPMVGRLIFSAEASKILANEDPLLKRFITGWKHMDETIFSAGAEYTYLDLLSLRGGYFVDSAGSVVGPSFGAGLQYLIDKKYLITADFAMIVAGDLTDYNKIFSVGFEF